jgi:hypothetical protein
MDDAVFADPGSITRVARQWLLSVGRPGAGLREVARKAGPAGPLRRAAGNNPKAASVTSIAMMQ